MVSDASARSLYERISSLEQAVSQNRDLLAKLMRADEIIRRAGADDEAAMPARAPRPRRSRPPGTRHLRVVKIAIILLVISGALWHAAQYHPAPRVTHVTAHARRARDLDAHAGRVDRA